MISRDRVGEDAAKVDTGVDTWLTSPAGVVYPPAPWNLRGTAYVSLWQIRASALPFDAVPGRLRPISAFGRVVVGTAFAIYEPAGDLAYHEVLAAVQVHGGTRPSVTVPFVWVDHPASVAGARTLWSIPKQEGVFGIPLAFEAQQVELEARAAGGDGQLIAALRFRSRTSIPGRWPVLLSILQEPLDKSSGRGVQRTPAQVWARVSLGDATWSFARQGPLGFLHGRNPLVSASLTQMTLKIGGRDHLPSERHKS
jgi:hypothetical protein